MTNHHLRYHQDARYEAGYNDGFDIAEPPPLVKRPQEAALPTTALDRGIAR